MREIKNGRTKIKEIEVPMWLKDGGIIYLIYDRDEIPTYGKETMEKIRVVGDKIEFLGGVEFDMHKYENNVVVTKSELQKWLDRISIIDKINELIEVCNRNI